VFYGKVAPPAGLATIAIAKAAANACAISP